MEKDYCKKCGNCCRKIKVDFAQRILYRDGIQTLTKDFESMLVPIYDNENITFCKCKYLEENLCTNSNKPAECREFPSSSFAFLPEECGYIGYIFLKSEQIKSRIRKMKEEIIHYEMILKKEKNKFENNNLKKIIQSHKAKIEKYKAFGSDDW